jgi:PleD family two-component response regulator
LFTRFDGEEFVVFMSGANDTGIHKAAERLRVGKDIIIMLAGSGRGSKFAKYRNYS